MTNREYLNSLDNEKFAREILAKVSEIECANYNPEFDISSMTTKNQYDFEEWLSKKHKKYDNKAVMLSIQPKQFEQILNGRQTLFLIKKIPKNIEKKFFVYIYCTKYVVGEFLCDEIKECNLHISYLKIYDKPKELGEFHKHNYQKIIDRLETEGCNEIDCYGAISNSFIIEDDGYCNYSLCPKLRLSRPPKPWFYVEVLSSSISRLFHL